MRLNLAIKGRLTRIVALSKQIVGAGRRIADAIFHGLLAQAVQRAGRRGGTEHAGRRGGVEPAPASGR